MLKPSVRKCPKLLSYNRDCCSNQPLISLTAKVILEIYCKKIWTLCPTFDTVSNFYQELSKALNNWFIHYLLPESVLKSPGQAISPQQLQFAEK